MNSLTDRQMVALTALYHDGAWTHDEVQARLSRKEVAIFIEQGILMAVRTEMGVMTLLGPLGRRLCLPATPCAHSPARQLDRAYVRLCVRARVWWASDLPLAPSLDLRTLGVGRLQRYDTPHGPAVVPGKMTGGGYSLKTMTEIADLLRAPALAYRFHVVIFTPSARRGQTLAARNTSFLQVVHKLPNENPAQPHPTCPAFNGLPLRTRTGPRATRVRRSPRTSPTSGGPWGCPTSRSRSSNSPASRGLSRRALTWGWTA